MVGHRKFASPRQGDRRPARRSGAVGNDYCTQEISTVKMSIFRSRARGAALVLALWALFLLSALIVSWALDIDSRLTVAGNASRILEAEALACSGAEVAMHPLIKPDSPDLTRRISARGSYQVRLTGEGGRLNLNLLVAGEDPVRLEIL